MTKAMLHSADGKTPPGTGSLVVERRGHKTELEEIKASSLMIRCGPCKQEYNGSENFWVCPNCGRPEFDLTVNKRCPGGLSCTCMNFH